MKLLPAAKTGNLGYGVATSGIPQGMGQANARHGNDGWHGIGQQPGVPSGTTTR